MAFTRAPLSAVITDAIGNTINLGNASGSFASAPTSIVLTDAAGNALSVGAGLSVNANGQGYAFMPWPGGVSGVTSAQQVSAVANTITVFQFVLDYTITINKWAVFVSVGSAATHVGVGIYSSAGSLLTSAILSSDTNATQPVASVTGVSIGPGVYYFAQVSDSVTPTCLGVGVGAANLAALLFAAAGSVNIWGPTNGVSSAGSLPTSMGSITAGPSVNPIIGLATS